MTGISLLQGTEINIGDTVVKKNQNGDSDQTKSFLKRFLNLKMIIIYFIVLLLLGGSLFAGWFFFLKGNDKAAIEKPGQAEQKNKAGKNATEAKKTPRFKDIVELAPFVKIKLRPSGRFSLLTMSIALKLADNNMRTAIEAEKKIIRSIIVREAGTMTWFTLRNPAGKLKLKYMLIAGINSAMKKSSKAKIENLYFTYFIMQ